MVIRCSSSTNGWYDRKLRGTRRVDVDRESRLDREGPIPVSVSSSLMLISETLVFLYENTTQF